VTESAAARAVSLIAAALVFAVTILYPRLIAADSAHVPYPWLVTMLLGMSFAWVHGFHFVPQNRLLRILFSPIAAWPLLVLGAWGVFLR